MSVTASFRKTRKQVRPARTTRLRQERLRIEELETRTVPSALGIPGVAHPQAVAIAPSTYLGTPFGYFPSQIRTAYGFDQIVFDNKNAFPTGVPADGQGQTIAIVDAYNDPYIQSDVNFFSSTFGLQQASLTQLDEYGNSLTASNTPGSNLGWGLETSLDVEWIHALAPKANILLFEAASDSVNDIFQAVQTAAATPGVSVVSMSFGISENFLYPAFEQYFDGLFATPAGHTPVSFVAASGDDGGGLFDIYGNFYPAPNYPSLVPTVLGVGGTSLTLNANNTYNSESAWIGSGGGQSFFEAEPAYQEGVQNSGFRQSPDVAFDANPNTGVAVYDTLGDDIGSNFYNGWLEVGGTSLGAPSWSALLAITNQGRAKIGLGPLGNPAADVYQLPSSDFHDITTGGNLANSAHAGYDLVTGLGTPLAQDVVHDLINSVEDTTPSGHGHGYGTGTYNQSVQVNVVGATPGAATALVTGLSSTSAAPLTATPSTAQASAAAAPPATPVTTAAEATLPSRVPVTLMALATSNETSQAIVTSAVDAAQPASTVSDSTSAAPAATTVTTQLNAAISNEQAAAPVGADMATAVPEHVGVFAESADPLAIVGLAAIVGGTWQMPVDDSQQARRGVWRF